MAYTAQDFSHLIGMPGLSENLLRNHFSLYQGYVSNTNKILEICDRLVGEGKADSLEHQEVTRHLGFEFDGMRVHEYYFRNLGGNGDPNQAPELKRLLEAAYGSYDNWKQHFRSIASTRGIGWAILYQDSFTGRLIDFWIDLHQTNHPAGCTPILVMDAWEHAYMLDYGTKRADYIDAFFRVINWPEAQKRVHMDLARQAQPA